MPCEYKLLLCMFLNGASFVKGKVHPKMKMMSSFIIQVSAVCLKHSSKYLLC